MNTITIDFETYYSKDYSLGKMTTEEYIRDPRFEVIGVAVQVNDGEPVWFSGTKQKIKAFLDGFDWANSIAVAHNAVFDMAILNWHFGIRPKRIVDTLSMARALHTIEVGGSLAALVEYYELGKKGDEVVNALGKHRLDMNEETLARYGEYCKNDVSLTYKLFILLTLGYRFPLSEFKLIDLTIRMFTEPKLELDFSVLLDHLNTVRAAKERLMNTVDGIQNGAVLEGAGRVTKEDIMSNPKFAEVLRRLGVTPPTKVSALTNKETYAFSKSDEGFKALLEHEDVNVQTLVAARLGMKSTLEETRTERFVEMSRRGKMPVPLRYYAAHTGRWGGDDKVNLQNLPRISPIKNAICAPEGYRLIDCDSSQIEARTLAWLAGQEDLVEAFEKGEDVYKQMASKIYGKDEAEITKGERFVGKTTILGCLAEGTLVLCDSGWKPIETISIKDKVWDGEEWVCHQGLLKKGCKETLNLSGVWLTPDHKVLCGTQWLEAQSVVQNKNTLSLALGTGAANLPSLGISCPQVKEREEDSRLSLSNAIVAAKNTQSIDTTLKHSSLLGAMSALKNLQLIPVNYIGGTQRLCLTMSTGSAYSTDYPQLLPDVIHQPIKTISITDKEGLAYTNNGESKGGTSLSMCKPSLTGITPSMKWIELITTKAMNLGTFGLYHVVKILKIKEKSKTSKKLLPTYDLAYAGPRNRFTVLSKDGPLIVHNCGYGMGAEKFGAQLKTFNVDLPADECVRIIQVYRESYPQIKQLWRQAQKAIEAMMNNQTIELGREGVLSVEGEKGIRLPNGLYLKYPNLRCENEGEYVYDTKRGRSIVPTRIYGGKLVENICQALARIVIGEQMLKINRKYPVVMTVHDAIACLVPEQEWQTGVEFVELCMRLRPEWALDLPLNCESGSGLTYGAC